MQYLFQSAYDCFPDKDYCVMTVPSTIDEASLSFFFASVPPRYDGVMNQNLYIMHKNTLLDDVCVKVSLLY